MTTEEFLKSVVPGGDAPEGLTLELTALWHAAGGDWERAHRIVQDVPSPTGSWVHANLHREEGDLGNARYWYARAGKTESAEPVETERAAIIEELLGAE